MRFENHDYAEFYDLQQSESGYPGKLLPPVIEALNGYTSVIDIGAGTGFFTIPLLNAGHEVTAVEPSSGMSDIIIKKCPTEKRILLNIINKKWENWTGAKHDAAICIHSLYPMHDVKKSIELMLTSADRKIIIVREPLEMKTITGLIRGEFNIKSDREFNSLVTSTLKNLGVEYSMTNIVEERPHRITDIGHEADSVLYHLKIDRSYRNRVLKMISNLCEEDSGGLFFRAVYSDNLYIF